MRRPDIIVVGVGRSGTSTIARLLQEEFGVLMAIKFTSPVWNPLGSYEDEIMLEHSRYLTEKPGYTVGNWLEAFDAHAKTPYLAGVKCNQLALLNYVGWESINPRLVIRTYRPLALTVDSMKRWREPKNEDHWVDFYREREKKLQKHLDGERSFPVLRINFDVANRVDQELISILRPWVNRLKHESI